MNTAAAARASNIVELRQCGFIGSGLFDAPSQTRAAWGRHSAGWLVRPIETLSLTPTARSAPRA